jgi:hypothetical protein
MTTQVTPLHQFKQSVAERRCPDCFGVGGALPGGEFYCNCDAA